MPAGNDFVAIAGGRDHSLALKADGSLVGWGYNVSGEATPPTGKGFIAISGGGYHSVAILVPEPGSSTLAGIAFAFTLGLRRKEAVA